MAHRCEECAEIFLDADLYYYCRPCDDALADTRWIERLGANLVAAGLAAELTELCEASDGNGIGPVLRYYAHRLGIAGAGES